MDKGHADSKTRGRGGGGGWIKELDKKSGEHDFA
jgi:hypothetical protein